MADIVTIAATANSFLKQPNASGPRSPGCPGLLLNPYLGLATKRNLAVKPFFGGERVPRRAPPKGEWKNELDAGKILHLLAEGGA